MLQYTGFVIWDRLERPAVGIVAMISWSLWTPPLWGRGSTTGSCTVCTFTLNLQWRQLLLHPGGRIRGSTIYGDEFSRASWVRRANFGEASPIQIAAMEKCLQFRHQHQHWHWHQHILDYSSIRHRIKADEHMHLNRNDDQHFHFICRAQVVITMENRLQCRGATVQQVMPISTKHRFILDYVNILHHTTGYEPLRLHSKQQSTLVLHLSSGSQYRYGEASPISTPRAQPMIRTERLHTGINDTPAGWNITFNAVHSKYSWLI